MALDAQSNWNTEMAQTSVRHLSLEGKLHQDQPLIPTTTGVAPRNEIHLPVEIILNIVSFLRRSESSQSTLWACTLVSKSWYQGSIARLYQHPYISTRNFQEFVRTVCPSKNPRIIKSELADMVQWFDMGVLSYDSTKSLTARLLVRLKTGLKRFIAPQASFGINCFASLSKCTDLEHLNLSLISASISMKLLYQTLRPLKSLRVLFLPRSSNSNEDGIVEVFWPPKLQALHLAGGIDDEFLQANLDKFPKTLDKMSIQHCSNVSPIILELFLQHVGPQLRELKISYPMSSLKSDSLNEVLLWCTNLRALRISVELVTPAFLDNILGEHPLRILDLDCSPGHMTMFTPGMISRQLTQGLTSLRSVRASPALGWESNSTHQEPLEDLSDELEAMEENNPLGMEAGVWVC